MKRHTNREIVEADKKAGIVSIAGLETPATTKKIIEALNLPPEKENPSFASLAIRRRDPQAE